MKTFILSLVISWGAFAGTAVLGGFGTDGASGEAVPNDQAVSDAILVYDALKHIADPEGDNNVIIQDPAEGEFSCEKPTQGIHSIKAGCMFVITMASMIDDETVLLEGAVARTLYEQLNVELNMSRVGVTIKEVANIHCTKNMDRDQTTKCVISNVMAREVDFDDM